MIHGVITRYNCSWFFLRKKHVCFSCNSFLQRKKREIIVNSESEEAKKYDFEVAGFIAWGNIKFITFYFECPNCRTIYEIEDLKKLEKRRGDK